MVSEYPKDFKFVGWLPNCRCTIALLKTWEEMDRDDDLIFADQDPAIAKKTVKDLLPQLTDWTENNHEKILQAKNRPYLLNSIKKK